VEGYLTRSLTQDQASNQVAITTISISVYVQILAWGEERGNKAIKEVPSVESKIKQNPDQRSRHLILCVLLVFS